MQPSSVLLSWQLLLSESRSVSGSELPLNASSYFETRPGTQYAQDHACILGLGMGLLSAVAVASAPSMVEILPLAIKAVRIAFRTGAVVSKVSSQLQETRTRNSWSMLIQNVKPDTVKEKLDVFYGLKVYLDDYKRQMSADWWNRKLRLPVKHISVP